MRVKISASAHKFIDFWMLKTFFDYVDDTNNAVRPWSLEDLPEEFVSEGNKIEVEEFEKAISIVIDDKVASFMNQKAAMDPRQVAGKHSYFIYRLKSDADEAEFIVKAKALDGMLFDI